MSFIMFQRDKKGRKYAYRATSVWDPVKKMPVSKREYLGRVDETTGEIIPKKSHKQDKILEQDLSEKDGERIKSLESTVQGMSDRLSSLERQMSSINDILQDISAVLTTNGSK